MMRPAVAPAYQPLQRGGGVDNMRPHPVEKFARRGPAYTTPALTNAYEKTAAARQQIRKKLVEWHKM